MHNFFNVKAKQIDVDKKLAHFLDFIKELPKDIIIVSADDKSIPTNKFLLSIFSPTLRSIFSDPSMISETLLLPDCASSTIEHFINIISKGVTSSSDISYRDIADVILLAKMLAVDITNLDEQINKDLEENTSSPIKVNGGTKKYLYDDKKVEKEDLDVSSIDYECDSNPDSINDFSENMKTENIAVKLDEYDYHRRKSYANTTAKLTLEKRKIINERRRQKRLRDLAQGIVKKHNYKDTHKRMAYSKFLRYCFSRSEVKIDSAFPINEAEKQLFEKCDEDQIYLFFFDYFWSFEVHNKEDGSTTRPKKKTVEAQKSHIKMSILQKHKINLADPLRFPSHRKDWTQYIENLN